MFDKWKRAYRHILTEGLLLEERPEIKRKKESPWPTGISQNLIYKGENGNWSLGPPARAMHTNQAPFSQWLSRPYRKDPTYRLIKFTASFLFTAARHGFIRSSFEHPITYHSPPPYTLVVVTLYCFNTPRKDEAKDIFYSTLLLCSWCKIIMTNVLRKCLLE